MIINFRILENDEIEQILPLVYAMNSEKISIEVLKTRFAEMITQHYKCLGIFDADKLIGCCGLWFMTRHYCGKSVEPDHVFIEEAYRSKGIGNLLFEWIYKYAEKEQITTVELNTYVQNYPSHKFYYNQGFEILGYHFLKKI